MSHGDKFFDRIALPEIAHEPGEPRGNSLPLPSLFRSVESDEEIDRNERLLGNDQLIEPAIGRHDSSDDEG